MFFSPNCAFSSSTLDVAAAACTRTAVRAARAKPGTAAARKGAVAAAGRLVRGGGNGGKCQHRGPQLQGPSVRIADRLVRPT